MSLVEIKKSLDKNRKCVQFIDFDFRGYTEILVFEISQLAELKYMYIAHSLNPSLSECSFVML